MAVFFICSSVVRHLGWFHSLTIVKRAAVNMGVQLFPLCIDLLFFSYMPKSGMSGS
jgi:hypothetical protein